MDLNALYMIGRTVRGFTTEDASTIRSICTAPRVTPTQAQAVIRAGVRPDDVAKAVLNDKEYAHYWQEFQAIRGEWVRKTGEASVQYPGVSERQKYDTARLALLAQYQEAHRALVIRWLGTCKDMNELRQC